MSNFASFQKRKIYSTKKIFFPPIFIFKNQALKSIFLNIPQFPQELILLNFFFNLFILFQVEENNNLLNLINEKSILYL